MITARTHRLLHILWTKAVGTPGYDKSEWTELERILHTDRTLLSEEQLASKFETVFKRAFHEHECVSNNGTTCKICGAHL